MKKIFLFLLILFSVNVIVKGTTKIAKAGDWDIASTWTPAGIPSCGDSIVIPAGVTVNIVSQLNYYSSICGAPNKPAMEIVVFGTLDFKAGEKMQLPCGSVVYIMTGGLIVPHGGGNSNLIDVCNIEIWNSGYGPITGPEVVECCSPLPIELISFSVIYNQGKVTVSWTTASEIDNDFFTIERTSDMMHYENIGIIDGAGNSNQILNYSFLDMAPLKSISYYRLKQTDYNGEVKYFNFVYVENINESACIKIYPNPNNGSFSIEGYQDNSKLTVFNSLGKVVISKNLVKNKIDLNGLSNGVYIVQIYCGGELIIQKINVLN